MNISMDMEKIIINYHAKDLQYEFPKRKWYQVYLDGRIAMVRLDSVCQDALDVDILLQICENVPDKDESGSQQFIEQISVTNESVGSLISYYINPTYKVDVYEALLKQYHDQLKKLEYMIIWDNHGEILPELLYDLSENKNYLSILTKQPEVYEDVLQRIEMDYGLVGMVFLEEKELLRYLKQMPVKNPVCMIMEEPDIEENDEEFKGVLDKRLKTSLVYCLPKESLFVDLSEKEIYRRCIFQKRMPIHYASVPIFLDNIAKNRYNSVVNEGITFQVINKKKHILWRRKGN